MHAFSSRLVVALVLAAAPGLACSDTSEPPIPTIDEPHPTRGAEEADAAAPLDAAAPKPGPEGGPGPDPGGLAPKIVAGYWQMYQGPKVAEITANAPQYNLQYASFAFGGTRGSGAVAFDPVFEGATELKADIKASKAAGSTWLLSIGGGSDNTTRLLTTAQATQMVSSLVPIIDAYGFQGVDFDLESGASGWSVAPMKAVATQLKAHYGKSFIISAAPRPYEDAYRDWAVAMGADLDLFGYQFYDFPETNDTAFLRSYVKMRVDQTVALGIPASKILVGCITYSQYGLGHNTVGVYRDIFKEVEKTYPTLRGVFIWETSLDKKENWSFAKTMGTAVRGL